ncbi:hypothetical protein [Pseudacidovorax intermedius]|uniref:Uncharacterized protein n=1 Tax=Pseudacidovorax intermedius TaxID=433924 RepID=A0A147H0A5_9BURK|nr:hypothetical protein [Pseudacidovorax intermedius]KTT23233.1 hypothetical protein NS331_08430 [Pseudacidovorax intermedius]
MTHKIIALHKPLTDAATGAPVTHFVISQYTVVVDGTKSQAVLQGYISAEAKAAGKRPLAHIAQDVAGTPEGDTLQWLYGELLKIEAGDLAGATAVLAADEATQADAA